MARVPDLASELSIRIARAIGRAELFAFVERLWPRLVLIGSIVGLFLIFSWLGLWPVMPDLLRFALLGLLGATFAGSAIWALRTPKPDRDESVSRVEQASRLTDRPLASLDDTPFDTTSLHGRALWQAHQERMAAQVKRLAAGLPAPRTDLLDRWALRAPVLLILVVAFFVAGPQRIERIEQAFAPPSSAPAVPVRMDVWADTAELHRPAATHFVGGCRFRNGRQFRPGGIAADRQPSHHPAERSIGHHNPPRTNGRH